MSAVAPGRPPRTVAPSRASTLFVLWLTSGSFYFCRVNVGPAVPSIRRELGLGALEVGLVLGAVKWGYALGQLVNGQLTERFGARRILATGMIGSAVATLLLAFSPQLAGVPVLAGAAQALSGLVRGGGGATFGVMLVLAFLNGWFQAGGWPPTVKIAARWFPVEVRGRTMGILGTSYTVGSALAILMVGALLGATGGWRVAFLFPAVLLVASFAHTSVRLREHPPGGDAIESVRGDRLPLGEALRATLGNARIWILALGLCGLDAVRYGFLDWAPANLAEVHRTGAMVAAMKTAVFPLAGAAGTLTSGWLTDRFFDSRRGPVCAILLGGVGVLTLTYRVVVATGVWPTVVCLALLGFCLYGAQILLVGTAAQDFARRGATAAAAGFVDFMGHVGASGSDVVSGAIRDRYGWDGVIGWWALAAFVSAGLVATLWRARPGEAGQHAAT
jgi:OPA family glycerol-3-phosphate transporter-like MFS transporter